MKDIRQCACGIAQDDCDYHKTSFKLTWKCPDRFEIEREYPDIDRVDQVWDRISKMLRAAVGGIQC